MWLSCKVLTSVIVAEFCEIKRKKYKGPCPVHFFSSVRISFSKQETVHSLRVVFGKGFWEMNEISCADNLLENPKGVLQIF